MVVAAAGIDSVGGFVGTSRTAVAVVAVSDDSVAALAALELLSSMAMVVINVLPEFNGDDAFEDELATLPVETSTTFGRRNEWASVSLLVLVLDTTTLLSSVWSC